MTYRKALDAFERLEAKVKALRQRLDSDDDNNPDFDADFTSIGTPMAAVAALMSDVIEDNPVVCIDMNAEHRLGAREMV